MSAAELAAAIERRAPEIARASSERMLADPFWEARFGRRGDHHTKQDGDFHVGYLVQALRLESAALLENYARWLRGVLVTRGMCSLHLREHLRALGEEVVRAGVPVPDGGLAVLDAGIAALTYADGDEGAVDRAAPAVAHAVAARLDGRVTAPREHEIREWLSFLADALATGRAAIVEGHVEFMRTFAGRPGIVLRPVDRVLEAIAHELQAALAPRAWRAVAPLLGRSAPQDEAAT